LLSGNADEPSARLNTLHGVIRMAKKSRMSVLKRQRELKKAEKAALKRERRDLRKEAEPLVGEDQVASRDDLAGYGFPTDDAPDKDQE
jgi:hypothetical protein